MSDAAKKFSPVNGDDQLAIWFTYHAPSEQQQKRYEAIRPAALAFAKVVRDNTPSGPDQTAALRKIREAVFTANAAIACESRS